MQGAKASFCARSTRKTSILTQLVAGEPLGETAEITQSAGIGQSH